MNTYTPDKTPNIYTIPPGVSFADSLAQGLLTETGGKFEKLATYLVLLPTKRACRNVREAFLRQTKGQPILLPQLQAFGDVDADELQISGQGRLEIDIPPAMPPIKRQIMLAQAIAKLPDVTKGQEQNMALARALAALMDQIHTEDLDLANLPDIVDREAFAEHWQITVDFLQILSEHWPKILSEQGMIDGADRRNRLINALNAHWQANPPQTPVIAAGSTGSIPATANLLKTISALPKGSIILPALDQYMSTQAWDHVEEGHPQATLKLLLSHLECERDDVQIWPHISDNSEEVKTREKIVSNFMVPPEATNEWRESAARKDDKTKIEKTLQHVQRYDLSTPQEEALLIALLLRETLEDKGKIGALVTPDRQIARRVAMACKRWGITIDDSAGRALHETSLGTYLRLLAETAENNLKPLEFLTLLKHEKTKGAGFQNFRKTVRLIDEELLRGTYSGTGFEALYKKFNDKQNDEQVYKKPDAKITDLIDHLKPILSPLITLLSDGYHDFSKILEAHIKAAEQLHQSGSDSENSALWQGEEGEEAANFLSTLREHAHHIPPVSGSDYLAILENLMKNISVRPRYGTHPRLMILGQLEARLIQADRVILAGLNEGTWPPDPGHDPWMSRPMRKKFGLPTPERHITLAAHDFVQGFCNKEVFLTRSQRTASAPTVPARWLQRLDTYLEAIGLDPQMLRAGHHQQYLDYLDKAEKVSPVSRPTPHPPVNARPTKLSVTKIETFLKDPYQIYAKEILKLNKLEPIQKEIDAAERGSILHEIMEKFTEAYPKNIPDTAKNDFITISKQILEEADYDITQWSFWMPRIIRMASWVIPHEQNWREHADFGVNEAKGKIILSEGLDNDFTLTARADRIDNRHDGSTAIIDYKSGGTYSKKRMETCELPQLPLEALILAEDGFKEAGIHKTKTGSISYWKITGGRPEGEIIEISDESKLEDIIETAKAGITNLIHVFENDDTPYLAVPRLDNAPRFNDYEHLERLKEWAALGEDGEEAA